MERRTAAALTSDTAERSLALWSETGRDQMQAFYAFAKLDYELLAAVANWGAALGAVNMNRGGAQPMTLLDVACGSGKFPAALLKNADLSALAESGVAYDLLDPSAFSLAEAAGQLRAPFATGASFETTLEDLDPAAGPWDVVWATHALYALRPEALSAAASRFVSALAPAGLGFMGQGAEAGHYLSVYRAFLDGMHGGAGTPYLSGEVIAGALRAAAEPQGWTVSEHRFQYEHVVGFDETELLQGYLRRCVFDDRPTLDEMLAAPVLGPYLVGCRDDKRGAYRFSQTTVCLALTPRGEDFPWTAAS
jgi:SAM-dependent methyltransferase